MSVPRDERLGCLPLQPDAALLRRASRRREPLPLPAFGGDLVSPIVARRLFARGQLDKRLLAAEAAQRVAGRTALERLLAGTLILLDPPHHAERRALAAAFWPAAGHDLRDSIDGRIRALVRLLPLATSFDAQDLVGRPAAAIVVEELLGTTQPSAIEALLAASPAINDLVVGDADLDRSDQLCGIAEREVRGLLSEPAALVPGRLLACLASEVPKVDMDLAVAITTFVATAAVETTKSLAVACLCAGSSAADSHEVLRWASPVPFAIYGSAERGDVVQILNLVDEPFGIGRHFCLGARIATTVGDSVLAELRRLQVDVIADGTVRWLVERFTRQLNARVQLVALMRSG